jgi:hypothetical protein
VQTADRLEARSVVLRPVCPRHSAHRSFRTGRSVLVPFPEFWECLWAVDGTAVSLLGMVKGVRAPAGNRSPLFPPLFVVPRPGRGWSGGLRGRGSACSAHHRAGRDARSSAFGMGSEPFGTVNGLVRWVVGRAWWCSGGVLCGRWRPEWPGLCLAHRRMIPDALLFGDRTIPESGDACSG